MTTALWTAQILVALAFTLTGRLNLVSSRERLSPVPALCRAVSLAAAVRTHRRLGRGIVPAAVAGALCLFIAPGSLL